MSISSNNVDAFNQSHLPVLLKIIAVTNCIPSAALQMLQVPAPSLGHDMAQLLESGQAADVRFKVEEEELAAHKFILTARSPVFRSGCPTSLSLTTVVGMIWHRLTTQITLRLAPDA